MPSIKDHKKEWSTFQEKRFLDSLGTYKGEYSVFNRKDLLVKYYEAMDSRKVWGPVSKKEIQRHIKMLLHTEFGLVAA